MSQEECQELLDFAIECRKRVKLQLQKMDDTFEAVDFSYQNKQTKQKVKVETLEVIEYNIPKDIDLPTTKELDSTNLSVKYSAKELTDGQKIIRDNQLGISYNNLFGDYLIDATEITIIDPYIRLPYQLRNLMELISLIYAKKATGSTIKLHLITNNNEDFIQGVKGAFNQITDSLESMDIAFSYEFDENIHDRSIQLNNGWKIVLGRGLDIWQKTGGWYDISEYIQERRLCKACEITFLRL